MPKAATDLKMQDQSRGNMSNDMFEVRRTVMSGNNHSRNSAESEEHGVHWSFMHEAEVYC